VRIEGYEQFGQNPPSPFTLLRSGKEYVFECTRGHDGFLKGELRTEVGTAAGYYTWLDADPAFTLRLPYPTAPEFVDSTFPCRYTPDSVLRSPEDLGRALGRTVQKVGEGPVADREAAALLFADSTPLSQSVWVDKLSGMTLRQVDRINGNIVYRREFDSVETNVPLAETAFGLPKGTIVIRGVVTPDILLAAWHGVSRSLADDLATMKAQSIQDVSVSLLSVPIPQGYDYGGTLAYEDGAGKVFPEYANPLTPKFPLFGDVPFNWIDNPLPPNRRDLLRDKSLSSRGEAPKTIPLAYQGPDGRVVPLVKTPSVAPPAEAVSYSQFLNRRTGDTISLFQLRGPALSDVLAGFALIDKKNIAGSGTGMTSYRIKYPCAVNIIEWHNGSCDYALTATGLDMETLERMANSAG
jgi:hypothetical protein